MGTYLDNYLESVESLPVEVKRTFSTMQELDVRSQSLLDKLEQSTRAYLQKRRTSKDTKSVTDDRALQKIREDFKKAMEYSDEKVSLAVGTYELVDKHIRRLDADLKKFEAELGTEQMKTPGRKGAASSGKGSVGSPSFASTSSKDTSKGHKAPAREQTPKTSRRKSSAAASTAAALLPEEARVQNVDSDMPIDPNEPTYCICNRVSFGEMVGCDNPDCRVEWFHFECVGLTSPPKGKWYCSECTALKRKAMMKK